MLLPVEVREELKAERGIYLTEACDACGALLGAVRYTRRGESGVWCSAKCRDGAEAVAARQQRRAGRPRKHANAAEKQRAYRARLRPLRNTLAAD